MELERDFEFELIKLIKFIKKSMGSNCATC